MNRIRVLRLIGLGIDIGIAVGATDADSGGPPAFNDGIELENGTGVIQLEVGGGFIQLET